MTARLLIAPAGSGKSMWVAREAKSASQDLAASPVICVARPLQVRAMIERLSALGGTLGVGVMTFDRLASECLTESRVVLPEPGREVTFRVLQSTIRSLGPSLEHFGGLADRAGLAEEVRRLLVELESARIGPPAFEAALDAVGRPSRLRDIGAIYAAYKSSLERLGWSDRPGIMTRAIGALGTGVDLDAPDIFDGTDDFDARADLPPKDDSDAPVDLDAPNLHPSTSAQPISGACRWSHLYVDGFDDLSASQIELLTLLDGRVGRLEITLTGDPDIASTSEDTRRAHHRFARTRRHLESALGIASEPLPDTELNTIEGAVGLPDERLVHLERSLYTDARATPPTLNTPTSGTALHPPTRHDDRANPTFDAEASIQLIEAPDRAGEVREALRWIKARILRDGMGSDDVALLARDVEPYRAAVMGIAAEMRIPIRLAAGLPLASNPAVAALLELLRLARRDGDRQMLMPRRQVVDAWRSPYFDWQCVLIEGRASTDRASDMVAGIGVDDAALSDTYLETTATADTHLDVAEMADTDPDIEVITETDLDTAAIADALDAVARWGSVIRGEAQWREAFERLESIGQAREEELDEDHGTAPPPEVPTGTAAAELRNHFDAFAGRLSGPDSANMRDHVQWLEGLIGSDPLQHAGGSRGESDAEDGTLRLVERCRRTSDGAVDDATDGPVSQRDHAAAIDVCSRDISALEALKDVLRALVAADEALAGEAGPAAITFEDFVADLVGAIDAAVVGHGMSAEGGAVLLADVVAARGLPFRALALLGMAEGEFPKTISESPLLRDGERRLLRDVHGLAIEDSTESAELEYFYESITRPSERLLLTRPRLADNGARWKASPFWEEVIHITDVQPRRLGSTDFPAPEDAAGIVERYVATALQLAEGRAKDGSEGDRDLEIVAGVDDVPEIDSGSDAAVDDGTEIDVAPEIGATAEIIAEVDSAQVGPSHARWRDVEAGAEVVRVRSLDGDGPGATTRFDGDLSSVAARLYRRYGPTATWSPSSLETMTACGYRFFVERALGVRPRQEPAAGLDAAQLGTIYHKLLEDVYEQVPPDDRTNAEALLKALDRIAGPILDNAPQRLTFRPTAWWRRTREGILETTRATLQALCEPKVSAGFTPIASELRFGIKGAPPLILEDGDDRLRIRGVIDRLEQSPDGRIRIVDYKTAGPTTFTGPKLKSGEKIQIALYALAARDALGLGEPVEGFYWHIQKAVSSGLKLSTADGGVEGALDTAAGHAWSAVRAARAGSFPPTPPKEGCPSYCAAAAFCWRYEPGKW